MADKTDKTETPKAAPPQEAWAKKLNGADKPNGADDKHSAAGASGFDVSLFIVDDDYEAEHATNTVAISVGRPHKQTFFRAHPDFRARAQILTMEEGLDKVDFVVARPIAETLPAGEYALRELRLLVSNFGELMIYPVGVPGDGPGGGNSWVSSAREAVEMAETQWLRMPSDRNKGRFIPRVAEDQALMGDPRWPDDISPENIMQRAFGEEQTILTNDHPALLKLRGKSL